MENIPARLVINFDKTGIKYVPTSSWTLEKEGSERVAIVGKDDQWKITAVIGCSMSGGVLPFQLNSKQYLKVCVSCVGPAVTLWACKLDGQ